MNNKSHRQISSSLLKNNNSTFSLTNNFSSASKFSTIACAVSSFPLCNNVRFSTILVNITASKLKSINTTFGPLSSLQQIRKYSGEVTWQEYNNRLNLPFRALYGETKGVPKCHGCHRKLEDKNELRIQVVGIFLPHSTGKGTGKGHPNKYTFCADARCVERAISDKDNKPDYRISYPEFDGRIGIPVGIKDKVGAPPPGIEWVEYVPDAPPLLVDTGKKVRA